MPLISHPIPAIYNGVSQQPATLRLDSQCEAQVNAYGTVVDGVRKRPGSQTVAKISATPLAGTSFIHTINRDVGERYIISITDGAIKVFDEAGVEKTVNAPLGLAYLAGADPANNFAVVSIADYSFIVNKAITVLEKTPTSVQPTNWDDWRFDHERRTNTEVRTHLNGESERYWNVTTGALTGTVQLFEDLPKPGDPSPPVNGQIYKVTGYDQDSFGSFYVVRKGGVWEETYKPGQNVGLDETTMPHALIRESDGTFTFAPFAWKVRGFGDNETNPNPSFVGKTIRDLAYYKNRLVIVSDENVVFSGAGDFGNFYRNTVTDLLDADVVDVAVSSTNVALLNFVVPFNNNLMLFADQTQFALNVDELLTPGTVSIDTVTNYEMSTKARPIPIGNDVYFVTENGQYSRIREYFVEDDKNQTEAADVTAHVPRFLPSGITDLAGNSNEDVLFAISNVVGERNRVYVYKFFWNEQGKAQSSWSYWEMDAGDRIFSISDLENVLYAAIERPDGVYLEKFDFNSGATAPGLTFDILLDRRTEVTGVYSLGDTTFTLPYPIPAGTARTAFKLVRGAAFTGEVGSLIDPATYTWDSDTVIRLVGVDESAGDVHAGVSYDMLFQFSEQFVKSGDAAITTGRLMLRTFTIYFTDTAFFSTDVAPYGNGDNLIEEIVPAQLSAFTGKELGASSLILGEPQFHTGRYDFQIYGDSKLAEVALRNNSHVQSKIQGAEWEALYYNRARSL